MSKTRCIRNRDKFNGNEKQFQHQKILQSLKKDGFITSIAEQGSGVRSLICLAVDILSAQNESIILIDEPELGLNPSAKQKFLEFLIEVSTEKQIFITTHDPTFVNPILWKDKEVQVAVYLHSHIEGFFKKIDINQNIDDPHTFAGFLPHTTSLKGIHIYVEGASDVYIVQTFLRKYLLDKYKNKNWAEKLNNVGIYHLNGDFWEHMLNTIPKPPYKCILIFDGDKKEKVIKICDNYKQELNIEFCDTLEMLQNVLNRDDDFHPVYCLKKSRIEYYLDKQLESKKRKFDKKIDGSNVAEQMDSIPKEFKDIFDCIEI